MNKPIFQTFIYLILSIIVVVFAPHVHLLIVYIDIFYTYINVHLSPIFSNSSLGIMISKIFLLTLIPILIAAIPALIYRVIKKRHMPYFIEVAWFLWLIIVLSKVLIR